MYTSGHDTWGPALCARRPDVTMATVEAYLHTLYRTPGDFVRACQTPMLLMPDDTPAHPYAVCMEALRCSVTAVQHHCPAKSASSA